MVRRPFVSLISGAAAAAVGFAVITPGGAAGDGRCPSVGRTVVRTSEARVWQITPRSGIDRYYGCAYLVGRAFRLDPRNGQVIGYRPKVRLAGTNAAYETMDLLSNGPYRVAVRSLRTGRILHRANSNARGSADGHTGPIVGIVLKRNGSVAWTASVDCVCEGVDPNAAGWEVHVIGHDNRHRVLDRGPDVNPRSVALSPDRTRVRWTHAGEVRTARLD